MGVTLSHQSSMKSADPFHLDYELLELYVDGKADDVDREIVDSHVAECAQCADELEDLVEFKEQSVASTTAESPSRWKQWFPQLYWLPKPAIAMVVVVLALIVAFTVLWWTRHQTRPQGQQAQTNSTGPEQPSPAPTEPNAQQNSGFNQLSRREEPLLVLNDAGGQVIVNQHGQLEGLHDLPPDLRASVEHALATRRLQSSPALSGWLSGAENLRGALGDQDTFAPLEPTDVVVETDRPTFRWRALEAARNYVVNIYDAKLRHVANSGPVTATEWTTPNSLARGVTYSWQITASQDGKTVVTPKPPLPEARFRILDQAAVNALVKLKRSAQISHLVLGVFYWKHGLLEEAEHEFQALAKVNPDSPAVAGLLASIRSLRRQT